MVSKFFVFAVLLQVFDGQCFHLLNPRIPIVNETLQFTLNKTASIAEALPFFNETSLANFTYTVLDDFNNGSRDATNSSYQSHQVDCLGLGKTVAMALEWFFMRMPNGSNALDVKFFLSSRKQPHRVQVTLGEQFGLEWTDFKMERRTVVIVHGFLSHGQESWIRDMEQAFLEWVSLDWASLHSIGQLLIFFLKFMHRMMLTWWW